MSYIYHLLIIVNILLILSFSLNILIGYSGLLSLCHAAFYGIGAYVTSLLMVQLNFPFFPATLIGIALTSLTALIIGMMSLRLKGDFFILFTLAFQMILFAILYNWTEITRGPFGVSGIYRPSLFGFQLDNIIHFFVFSLVLTLIALFLINRLCVSPFGRVLQALREDEIAIQTLGKNILVFKVQAFMISAAFPALAGSLYATYVSYIDPTSFSLEESIFLVTIVIFGGTGNFKGPLIGVLFMVLFPEILQFFNIPNTYAAPLRQIVLGATIVILMLFRPQGIAGKYSLD